MLVKTYGCAVHGILATKVTIEVDMVAGVNFYLVGLPDSAVKESHQRIDAALKNTGYRLPGKQITINMAPADIKKEGSSYDLPLALGILGASGQVLLNNLEDYVIMGELSLDWARVFQNEPSRTIGQSLKTSLRVSTIQLKPKRNQ